MPHCEGETQEHEALQRNHHARRDARVPGSSRSRHGKSSDKSETRQSILKRIVSCYIVVINGHPLLLQID